MAAISESYEWQTMFLFIIYRQSKRLENWNRSDPLSKFPIKNYDDQNKSPKIPRKCPKINPILLTLKRASKNGDYANLMSI